MRCGPGGDTNQAFCLNNTRNRLIHLPAGRLDRAIASVPWWSSCTACETVATDGSESIEKGRATVGIRRTIRPRFPHGSLLLICLLSLWTPVHAQMRPPDVEYVPTPRDVVTVMLETAGVTKDDVVYDLGCGDGRFLITAAQIYGARGVGIDIDPERIRESNANARKAGVTDRVTFVQGDLFKVELSEATVITLYLLPELNVALRPRLLQLRPGTRIVSHEFDMGEWVPDKRGVVKKARFDSSPYLVFEQDASYYFWVVPANVAGEWRWSIPALGRKENFTLRLGQTFQKIEGAARVEERTFPIVDARLTGDALSFASTVEVSGQKVTAQYQGRVMGDSVRGSVDIPEGPFSGRYDWSATRTKK